MTLSSPIDYLLERIPTEQVQERVSTDLLYERVSTEQQFNTTAATGKFKSNSDLEGQANILYNEQDFNE